MHERRPGNPPPLELRRLARDDAPRILEVYRQCEDFLALGPQPHASLEMVIADLEQCAAEDGIFCGIFGRCNQLIGVVAWIPAPYLGHPEEAFLSLLMIAQPWRRQGIGSQIVRQVEDAMRQDPRVTTICSGVQVNNPHAIRFWQHHGYRIVSDPQANPDGTTVFDLRKP